MNTASGCYTYIPPTILPSSSPTVVSVWSCKIFCKSPVLYSGVIVSFILSVWSLMLDITNRCIFKRPYDNGSTAESRALDSADPWLVSWDLTHSNRLTKVSGELITARRQEILDMGLSQLQLHLREVQEEDDILKHRYNFCVHQW